MCIETATGFSLDKNNPITTDVWCPTTSNGLWVAVDQEGKEFITGNSSINLAQIPATKEFRGLFTAPTYYEVDDTLYSKVKRYIDEDR